MSTSRNWRLSENFTCSNPSCGIISNRKLSLTKSFIPGVTTTQLMHVTCGLAHVASKEIAFRYFICIWSWPWTAFTGLSKENRLIIQLTFVVGWRVIRSQQIRKKYVSWLMHGSRWNTLLDRGSRSSSSWLPLFYTIRIHYVPRLLFCMGVKLGRWHCRRKGRWGCLRTWCWGEHLDLGGTR